MSSDKITIEDFVKAVDRNIEMRCGVSVHDLPDVDFHSYWEDAEDNWNDQVKAAADDALNRAGWSKD